MITKFKAPQAWLFCTVVLGVVSSFSLAAAVAESAATVPAKTSIPWSQLGAKAGADYRGNGLAVSPAAQGARLRCVFQRLEGAATPDGLWLTSIVSNTVNDRFRVVAASVGRSADAAASNPVAPLIPVSFEAPPGFGLRQSSAALGLSAAPKRQMTAAVQNAIAPTKALAPTGTVAIDGQTVRFTRPGLVEEYSVSMDGVRQDFVVLERPPGASELAVQLAVSGARAEQAAGGARLVLEHSGRKIAYSRLRATDATGKELAVRMEVLPAQAGTPSRALAVVVNDTEAVYPVRIDPTFSDANWVGMGGIPGTDGTVFAAVLDGSGNLYIGGDFTVAGSVIANCIAKWDGSNWSALGSGMGGVSYPYVYALAVSGSNLYAGGYFTTAGGSGANFIARWNGSSWTALDSGMNATVRALAVSGNDVYAGGDFTTAGGNAANFIAKWNGTSWSAMGSGMNSAVYAVAVSGIDLYMGGHFTTAGGNAANFIVKWNGTNWTPLGSGMGGGGSYGPVVYALAVSGSDLYAGGDFTTAGGSAATNIAKWDGSSWSALSSGMGGGVFGTYVYALAVSGSDLYAGGDFTTAGGSAANCVAKWNGSSWSALGSGMVPFFAQVHALTVSGSDAYAGGQFTTAGGSAANNIAKWSGSSWSALGLGMGGGLYGPYVYVLAATDSALYVGGDFSTAGGRAANNVVKWNGSSWSALGSGMDVPVFALAASGGNVYVGGPVSTIAKWDGSSWSALGSGMGPASSSVRALAVSGSDLYAGGSFTTAGGSAATNIAKWNGTNWSALGSGVGGLVYALVVSGSNVYAGGSFTTAGGSAANNIAKWDGSSWSALGSGMNDWVRALAVSGGDLYAGGYFTNAGGSPANYIAKWNGTSWSALGSGMGGGSLPIVYALAVSGGDLYAGGGFTMAGGGAANSIAKWDGSGWTALGSGMGGSYASVFALAVSGSDLYAGGAFTTAGGKVSAYIARAYLPALPALSVRRSGTNIMVSWPSANTAGFALLQAHTLAPQTSWVTNGASVADDGTNKWVTLPATNSPQFFRLRSP